MPLRHALARSLVSALPSDVGLWRLRPYLPACPDPQQYRVERLRGFPLRFRFKPGTYAGWFLFYRGLYEEHNIQLLRRLLREGMNFVDIGANIGLYSTIGAWKIGPEARVLAFEPQPDLAELVLENAALNGLPNVVLRACALGASAGTARLFQSSRTNDGAATLQLADGEKSFGEPLPVEVRTLSSVLEECQIADVGAMKIDIEGAELRALEGCADFLRRSPPEFILFECIDAYLKRFGDRSADLLRFFWELGYRTACLYRGRWRPLATIEDHRKYHAPPDLVAVHPASPTWDRFTELSQA